MMHHVKDLSPEQRVAIESLLGRSVSEDEAVSIKALNPSAIVPSRLTGEGSRSYEFVTPAVRQGCAVFRRAYLTE